MRRLCATRRRSDAARAWYILLGPCAGFVTKKGIHHLLPGFAKYDFHAALTIEGRADEELPEQTLLATRIHGLDITSLAHDGDMLGD